MSVFDDVRVYWDTESSVDGIVKIIGDVLSERGINGGVIGFEETFASFEFHSKLQSGSFMCNAMTFKNSNASNVRSACAQ